MAWTLACARSWSRCSRSFVYSSPAPNMVPSFPVVSLDVPASSDAAQGGGGISMPNSAALAATFRLERATTQHPDQRRALRFPEDDPIPLNARYFPTGYFGAERTEPMRSLFATVHRFLALPKGHYHQLAVLGIGEKQQPLEAVKPL